MYKPHVAIYTTSDQFAFKELLENVETRLAELENATEYTILKTYGNKEEIMRERWYQTMEQDADYKKIEDNPDDPVVRAEWVAIEDEVCHFCPDAKDNWLPTMYYVGHDRANKWRRIVLVHTGTPDDIGFDEYVIIVSFDDVIDAVAFKLMVNE